MKNLPLVFIYSLLTTFSYCQQKTNPGYVLLITGDTLHVDLEDENMNDLLLQVKYKKDGPSSTVSIAHPGEVAGFGYLNGSVYKSIRFSDNAFDSTSIKNYFAEQLLAGAYDLFAYQQDGQKVYVISNENQYYVLTNTTYTGRGEIKEEGQYQNRLLFLAVQCNTLQKNIDVITYNDQSLIKFVTELNNCTNPNKSVINYYHKEKSKFELIAFAGALPINNSLQIGTEIMARFSYPKLSHNAYVTIGLHYSQTPYTYTSTVVTQNWLYGLVTKDVIFSIPFLIQYNFLSGGVQPYIGMGASISGLKQSVTNYKGTTTYNRIGVGPVAELGIEAKVVNNLLIKAAWRFEEVLQYPVIGVALIF